MPVLFGSSRRILLTIASSLAIVVSPACGKSNEKTSSGPDPEAGGAQSQAAKQVTAGAKQVADGAKQVARGVQSFAEAAAKPVEFESLKALLPDVDGWKKDNAAGELLSLPTPYSTAHARYSSGTTLVDLEITDSALSQVLLPISMFLASGFEEKSDDGHTRALNMHGSPGYENWNKTGRTADVTVVVVNRFVVRGKGREVTSVDPVKALVQAVNLTQLGKLK